MITLLNTIADVAQGLTAGTMFATNTGGTAEIVYHRFAMPPRSKTLVADIAPFCLVKARGFGIFPGRKQEIELLFSLYNEDRTAAMTDMGTLMTLLEPLAVRGQQYRGWKLSGIHGFAGDRDTGVQPHPEYYLTVLMDLIAPSIK